MCLVPLSSVKYRLSTNPDYEIESAPNFKNFVLTQPEDGKLHSCASAEMWPLQAQHTTAQLLEAKPGGCLNLGKPGWPGP